MAGAPGHGKSTLMAKIVKESPDRDALIYKEELDIDDAAYKAFPRADIWKYKGGKVKISSFDIKYDDFLALVEKGFRNGILVIDEGRLYEMNELSERMTRLAALRRKLGIDIYILFHGITQIPIRSFSYINNVILFNTADNFKYKSGKVPEIEPLMKAKDEIRKEVMAGNKYAARVIKIT